MVLWNLLDGGPSHSAPLFGPSESMRGGTSGTNPRQGAATTQRENINEGPPWEAMPEIRERPPLIAKMSMVVPLRGDVGDPGAPTNQCKNVNGGTHHLMSESSMVGPQAPVGGLVSSQDPKSVL
jgi:hypothetical protein